MSEPEPFQVGQSIIWHQGEEMGHTIAFGTITKVKGPPRTGTLVCEFQQRPEPYRTHEFRKADGESTTGDGYIRLA